MQSFYEHFTQFDRNANSVIRKGGSDVFCVRKGKYKMTVLTSDGCAVYIVMSHQF